MKFIVCEGSVSDDSVDTAPSEYINGHANQAIIENPKIQHNRRTICRLHNRTGFWLWWEMAYGSVGDVGEESLNASFGLWLRREVCAKELDVGVPLSNILGGFWRREKLILCFFIASCWTSQASITINVS